MRVPAVLIAVLVLAVGGAGCSKRSRVTEEDRVVVDMNVQIAEQDAVDLHSLEASLGAYPEAYAAVKPAIAALTERNADAGENSKQLRENWGAPKTPLPYTPENAKKARDASKKSHSTTFWGAVGAALLAGGGVALGLVRKFGRFIPGIGPIFEVGDKLIAGIEVFMAKRKAAGDVEAAKDLGRTLLELQEKDPKVKAYVQKRLEYVKQKYGIEVAKILEDALPPPPTPAPVPAAAPEGAPTT